MPIIVRAFPLTSGVEDLKAFAAAMNERSGEADAFFQGYGVAHESWHVQETPAGPWVIGVTVIDDPDEAAPRYAKSSATFDAWFKRRVFELSGVNLDEQPLGPPTTQVYAWNDSGSRRIAGL